MFHFTIGDALAIAAITVPLSAFAAIVIVELINLQRDKDGLDQ